MTRSRRHRAWRRSGEPSYIRAPSGAKPGVISTYGFGSAARVLGRMGAGERKRTFLAAMRQRLGPRAAVPVAYLEHDWAVDPWTRGCHMTHYAPGC